MFTLDTVHAEENEQTSRTNEIIAVEWKLKEGQGEFDSSASSIGKSFIYIPVLPETYEGYSLKLGENVSLPEITVTIQDKIVIETEPGEISYEMEAFPGWIYLDGFFTVTMASGAGLPADAETVYYINNNQGESNSQTSLQYTVTESGKYTIKLSIQYGATIASASVTLDISLAEKDSSGENNDNNGDGSDESEGGSGTDESEGGSGTDEGEGGSGTDEGEGGSGTDESEGGDGSGTDENEGGDGSGTDENEGGDGNGTDENEGGDGSGTDEDGNNHGNGSDESGDSNGSDSDKSGSGSSTAGSSNDNGGDSDNSRLPKTAVSGAESLLPAAESLLPGAESPLSGDIENTRLVADGGQSGSDRAKGAVGSKGGSTDSARMKTDSGEKDDREQDESAPFIKGEGDRQGWDVVRARRDEAQEGDTVYVDMNGAVVVPGDVLEGIRGKDITMSFDLGNGISWSVNGKSVTADSVKDIDFSVETDTDRIPVEVINQVTGERYNMQLSLAYEGEFGFTAVLSVPLGEKNAGLYANLFYYNAAEEALEFVCSGEIGTDGTAKLAFTHASDYTVIVSEAPMDEETVAPAEEVLKEAQDDAAPADESELRQEDNGTAIGWIIGIAALVLVIALAVLLFVKNRKRDSKSA